MKPVKEGKVREIYDNGDSLIMVAMIAMVDGMGIKQDFICKIVVSAISLVLNYIFSKWFIFKKKES